MRGLACVLACLLAAGALHAEDRTAADQATITGSRVTESAMADTDPVAMVGKRGVMAVMTGGLDTYCEGHSILARHAAESGFEVDGEAITLDALIALVTARGESLRCLRIQGDRPDRENVALLREGVVAALGATLILPAD